MAQPSQSLAARSSFSTPNLVDPGREGGFSEETRVDLDIETDKDIQDTSVHQRLDLANTFSPALLMPEQYALRHNRYVKYTERLGSPNQSVPAYEDFSICTESVIRDASCQENSCSVTASRAYFSGIRQHNRKIRSLEKGPHA